MYIMIHIKQSKVRKMVMQDCPDHAYTHKQSLGRTPEFALVSRNSHMGKTSSYHHLYCCHSYNHLQVTLSLTLFLVCLCVPHRKEIREMLVDNNIKREMTLSLEIDEQSKSSPN